MGSAAHLFIICKLYALYLLLLMGVQALDSAVLNGELAMGDGLRRLSSDMGSALAGMAPQLQVIKSGNPDASVTRPYLGCLLCKEEVYLFSHCPASLPHSLPSSQTHMLITVSLCL